MEEILTPDKLKVSSNEAMMNSLTDGSTETFWESRDDARDKPRSVTATFIKPVPFFGAAVHVDNLKDAGVSKWYHKQCCINNTQCIVI